MEASEAARLDEGTLVLIVPRLGTVSPWSSKATDIAQVCGLSAVQRVERGIAYRIRSAKPLDEAALRELAPLLHDRMTETVLWELSAAEALFEHHTPRPLATVPVMARGREALLEADKTLGLALAADEIDYLLENFQRLKRDPTDVELMMFAQANSSTAGTRFSTPSGASTARRSRSRCSR